MELKPKLIHTVEKPKTQSNKLPFLPHFNFSQSEKTKQNHKNKIKEYLIYENV